MPTRKRHWTRKVMIRGEIVWVIVNKYGHIRTAPSFARDDQAGALEFAAKMNAQGQHATIPVSA